MSNIKTWQERGVKMPVVYEANAFCNDAPVCPACKVNEAIAAMQAEINDLRTALVEQDAEIERLRKALIACHSSLQYAVGCIENITVDEEIKIETGIDAARAALKESK